MAVTDLTGTTWVINETPNYAPFTGIEYSAALNFISNNTNFRLFYPQSPSLGMSGLGNTYYWYADASGSVNAYSSNARTGTASWTNEVYRTVQITGGSDATNSTVIAWFEANAVQQTVTNETYITNDVDLTSVADAIRTKGSTSASLVYPAGYVSAINALQTGTLQSYKSAIYTSPGTATILPDSGYVGIAEISVEYSPSIYDGAYHTESGGAN